MNNFFECVWDLILILMVALGLCVGIAAIFKICKKIISTDKMTTDKQYIFECIGEYERHKAGVMEQW